MNLNLKKTFGIHALYKNILALWGLYVCNITELFKKNDKKINCDNVFNRCTLNELLKLFGMHQVIFC